jgi:hypothetical protein
VAPVLPTDRARRGHDRTLPAGSVRSRAYPILLAGVALGFDAADRRVPFSVLASGLLDEVAHLATGALGLLVLACLVDVPRRFYAAGALDAVAAATTATAAQTITAPARQTPRPPTRRWPAQHKRNICAPGITSFN